MSLSIALCVLFGSASLGPRPSSAATQCGIPEPIATPRAEAPSVATPVDGDDLAAPRSRREALRSGLQNLVKIVAACKSAGDFETMSRLVTEEYLGQIYGGGPRMSRQTFLALADSLPTPRIRFRDFDDLSLAKPGEASANVKLIVGNQLTFERVTFIEERPGVWLLDSATPLRVKPPRDHETVHVTITKNRYNPAELSATNGTVNIRASNSDPEGHELLVLQLAEGVTINALLTQSGPQFPAGVSYLGQVTVPARSSGNIVLVDLKPGVYAIVDLLPGDNGVPHLAVGMEATLAITAE